MMSDPARMRSYNQLLQRVVKPGAVVVDIGTGMGVLSLLACRLGARRVYAIEPSDVINVARSVAAANGYADRIVFYQSTSMEVDLPERADVVIADLVGMLPWYEHSIDAIVDARRRFLAPGGLLVPQSDAAWAALVDAQDLYDRHIQPWQRLGLGFDLGGIRELLTNLWERARLLPDQLLTKPRRFVTIDYNTIADVNMRERLSWTLERGGTMHFIALGMDRMAGSPEWFSNAPDAPADRQCTLIRAPMLLPLPAPVSIQPGDTVSVDVSGSLAGDDYVWNWNTSVTDANGRRTATFAQSSFLGIPVSVEQIRQFGADAVPTATDRSRIALVVLKEVERGATLGEIAARVQAAYPSRFPRLDAALTYVASVVHECC
jgi:protein arginine N-methyltransferase 1